MEINIVFRIAAVGILVAVLHQVLMRAGREEQAMLTTLAGLIVVLMMMIYEHAGRVGCGAVLGDSIHQPAV